MYETILWSWTHSQVQICYNQNQQCRSQLSRHAPIIYTTALMEWAIYIRMGQKEEKENRIHTRKLSSHGEGRKLHSHGESKKLHSYGEGRKLHSHGEGRELHSYGEARNYIQALGQQKTTFALGRQKQHKLTTRQQQVHRIIIKWTILKTGDRQSSKVYLDKIVQLGASI